MGYIVDVLSVEATYRCEIPQDEREALSRELITNPPADLATQERLSREAASGYRTVWHSWNEDVMLRGPKFSDEHLVGKALREATKVCGGKATLIRVAHLDEARVRALADQIRAAAKAKPLP